MRAALEEEFAEATKLHDAGHLERAREVLLDLANRSPQSVRIHAALGHVCWDMQRLDEAVVAFRHATGLSPRLEGVSLGLFNCLWELGRREEAMEELKRFQSVADSTEYGEIVKAINQGPEAP